MRIAIVGPAGSGKTTFAKELAVLLKRNVCAREKRQDTYNYISCDEWVASVYADATEEYPEVAYIHKVCPQCLTYKTKGSIAGGCAVYAAIDKKILGTFLFTHAKERRHLENLFYKGISDWIQMHTNCIVDGILPRFLKKLPFDVVLYVHTESAERNRRLRKRGVTPKRIAEITKVQQAFFRDPINWRNT